MSLIGILVLLTSVLANSFGEEEFVGLLQTKLEVQKATRQAQNASDEKSLILNNVDLNVDVLSRSNHNETLQRKVSVQPDCFSNTGGTCMIRSCSIARGPTTCSFGQCLCQMGYCAGANGACYEGPYKLVLDDFTIRNYRWDGEYMYASIFEVGHGHGHALKIDKDNRTDQSRFRLYEMPDGAAVITNKAYPMYAITISKHISHGPVDYDSYSTVRTTITYDVQLSHIGGTGLITFGFEPVAARPALQIFSPPLGDYQSNLTGGAVMIGSWLYPRHYLYVPGMSWTGEVYEDDPGDGGLWIFDPPLPASFPLKRFEGRICSFDCSGSVSFGSQALKVVGLAVAISSVIGVPLAVVSYMVSRR